MKIPTCFAPATLPLLLLAVACGPDGALIAPDLECDDVAPHMAWLEAHRVAVVADDDFRAE